DRCGQLRRAAPGIAVRCPRRRALARAGPGLQHPRGGGARGAEPRPGARLRRHRRRHHRARRQRAHRQQPDRGQLGLDRCLGRRPGVRRLLALQGPQPPPRYRQLPRSRGQYLELSPPLGVSAELAGLLESAGAELAGHEAARRALCAASPAVRSSLGAVFAASDFVIAALTRDPDLLAALVASGDLERTLAPAEFAARAPPPPPPGTGTEAQLQTALRRWRRREFTRIAWRDLAGWADLPETLTDLSAFADAAIAAALAHARAALSARYGE